MGRRRRGSIGSTQLCEQHKAGSRWCCGLPPALVPLFGTVQPLRPATNLDVCSELLRSERTSGRNTIPRCKQQCNAVGICDRYDMLACGRLKATKKVLEHLSCIFPQMPLENPPVHGALSEIASLWPGWWCNCHGSPGNGCSVHGCSNKECWSRPVCDSKYKWPIKDFINIDLSKSRRLQPQATAHLRGSPSRNISEALARLPIQSSRCPDMSVAFSAFGYFAV